MGSITSISTLLPWRTTERTVIFWLSKNSKFSIYFFIVESYIIFHKAILWIWLEFCRYNVKGANFYTRLCILGLSPLFSLHKGTKCCYSYGIYFISIHERSGTRTNYVRLGVVPFRFPGSLLHPHGARLLVLLRQNLSVWRREIYVYE